MAPSQSATGEPAGRISFAYALHNPVTLHVVCHLRLLRSYMEAGSVT
jgi:hypothetical protein